MMAAQLPPGLAVAAVSAAELSKATGRCLADVQAGLPVVIFDMRAGRVRPLGLLTSEIPPELAAVVDALTAEIAERAHNHHSRTHVAGNLRRWRRVREAREAAAS
jgi:hypothetical protein